MIVVEMDADACRSLLAAGRVAILALCDNGQPYAVPISYVMQGEVLYGFTLPGRKLDLMRASPRIALLVEDHGDDGGWRTVHAEGRFDELPDAIGSKREREIAVQALMQQPDWWQPGALKPMYPPRRDDRSHIFFRIHIERLTGRQAVPTQE